MPSFHDPYKPFRNWIRQLVAELAAERGLKVDYRSVFLDRPAHDGACLKCDTCGSATGCS